MWPSRLGRQPGLGNVHPAGESGLAEEELLAALSDHHRKIALVRNDLNLGFGL